VIEIGPGRGALTERCSNGRAGDRNRSGCQSGALSAPEISRSVAAGRLELIEGDILKADFAAGAERPVIARQLAILHYVADLEARFSICTGWERAGFLVQAKWPSASPPDRARGTLGYLTCLGADARPRRDSVPVGREAFRPHRRG